MKSFAATFPAIDGIDMDCEETYDVPSFAAFCKMLIGIGFGITFCPYISDGILDHGAGSNRTSLSGCREMVEFTML